MIAVQADTQPRFAVLPPRGVAEPGLTAAPAASTTDISQPFGEDGLTFLDVLDIVNPLQHLPLIGTLYREWTGDTLSPAARIAGDILYGGPIGAFVGINNAITESATGKDIGQHVLAWLRGGDEPDPGGPPATLLADDARVPNPPAPAMGTSGGGTSGAMAVAALQGAAIPAPAAVEADSALAAAAALDDGNGIVDPRRVTFAPPARSRLPLAPPETPRAPRQAEAPATPVATPRPAVVSTPDRAPLFAVVPPAAAPLFGPGPARTAAASAAAVDAPAGSVALDGGWFSDTMLSALHKYQQDMERKPAAASAPRAPESREAE